MAVKIDSGLQITFFSGWKFDSPQARPSGHCSMTSKSEIGHSCLGDYSNVSSSSPILQK